MNRRRNHKQTERRRVRQRRTIIQFRHATRRSTLLLPLPLLLLKICNIKPLPVLPVVVGDDLNVICSVKLLSFSLHALFLPRKTQKNNCIWIRRTGTANPDIISSLCCNKRLHQRFVVYTFCKVPPYRYHWGQSRLQLQHIPSLTHWIQLMDQCEGILVHCQKKASKQLPGIVSYSRERSIKLTIILNFSIWMKELKELSSWLQFASSTREALYTAYTKCRNLKKLWHKFCYNPSTRHSFHNPKTEVGLSFRDGIALAQFFNWKCS